MSYELLRALPYHQHHRNSFAEKKEPKKLSVDGHNLFFRTHKAFIFCCCCCFSYPLSSYSIPSRETFLFYLYIFFGEYNPSLKLLSISENGNKKENFKICCWVNWWWKFWVLLDTFFLRSRFISLFWRRTAFEISSSGWKC